MKDELVTWTLLASFLFEDENILSRGDCNNPEFEANLKFYFKEILLKKNALEFKIFIIKLLKKSVYNKIPFYLYMWNIEIVSMINS